MYFGLTQQLIRQNVEYWMLYVALRPDRNHKLISYPYYAKLAQNRDSTVFKHIDINVPRYLANGRGAELIQGFVSLDHEAQASGCTVLVPGFHHHFCEWWSTMLNCTGKQSDPEEWVHDIGSLWTPQDAEKYGDFIPVPCMSGDVRVTQSEIIHGSTASTGNVPCRTIFPWFVGVQTKERVLDVEECDDWSALSHSHITQTALKLTPSRLANRCAVPLYQFPASVQLETKSYIGQALVCRMQWEDPLAVKETQEILSLRYDAAKIKI